MPVNFTPSSDDLLRFAPELVLTVAATMIMVLDPFFAKKSPRLFGHFSIVALIVALFAAAGANSVPGPAYSDLLVIDGFGTFFRILVIGIGILAVLSSYRYLEREKAETSEFHALLLFSIVGQCVMVTANDLIMIFIGLEISSIATYVLAGYLRDDKRNNEAALKYFLLGSFATAFFLYGVALVYGITGSTKLDQIRTVLAVPESDAFAMVSVAAALMFVGLAFKVSAAPFQIWAPDVYQGAPAPVSAFMATGPKAAAFAIFLRIFLTAFQSVAGGWEPVIWISALLSMTIGNFAALTQSNLKRMLAYSSIAHAGYILVALAARSEIGTAAAMFYLAGYAFMNIGAFAVVIHISGKGERNLKIDDLAGLSRRQPVTAAMMTVFLLSLIGVPLTGGFFGKFYIFRAALDSHLVWLTVLGLLNSAVAAYYYLRLLVVMYMHEPGEVANNVEPLGLGLRMALALSAIGTFALGVVPGAVVSFAQRSAMFVR
ncbi:MAG TPA: NADH-quinone oxidoreductase subunit N [Bryobacteraceae bacterium]|jgi:NADH-quinone oxidoreductase subunit N|nr:NADH-quinone oxidoreductase subunit N [Bryobacteraceae bacterium]